VFAAAEAMELEIHGEGRTQDAVGDSALERRSIVGQRILLVSSEASDLELMEQTLVDDGLILIPADDSGTALKRVEELAPNLVIIDEESVPDHKELARLLRQQTGRPNLPVILLTREGAGDEARLPSDDVTDYLERPFSHPMLRSRVRAWVARTISVRAGDTGPKPLMASPEAENGNAPSSRDDANMLARTQLFRDLRPDQIGDLISNASEQIFPTGYPILRQGDPGTSVFVIVSGKVRIMEEIAEGPVDMFLGELGVGEVFGEIGFLKNSPRSATVVPLEHTRCLVLSHDEFLKALESSPALSVALLRVLAGRLSDADRLLARYAPDPLTGLPGRRAFHDLYFRLAAAARQNLSRVTLILVDIQDLKGINDTIGYDVGDEVLKATSQALIESSRPTDMIARAGGDEFAMLLIDPEPDDCDSVRRRVGERLAEISRRHSSYGAIEVDVGIASSDHAPDDLDGLLRQADDDMRKNKLQKTVDS
jgi:diguanylate cyclase (GGDEF)-like protein